MELLPGIYRHYTGLLVQFLGIAEHTETKEELAIYITLSPKATNHLRARPLTMFLESVQHKGEYVPRFCYLGQRVPDDEAAKDRDVFGQYSA